MKSEVKFIKLIIWIVLICLLIGSLLNLYQARQISALKTEVSDLRGEIQQLKDDQAMTTYNQKRLIDAMTNWLEFWQADEFEATAYSPLDDRIGKIIKDLRRKTLLPSLAMTRVRIIILLRSGVDILSMERTRTWTLSIISS